MSLVNKDGWEEILFLLEKGADRNHVADDGQTLENLLTRQKKTYTSSGITTPELFKKVLEKMRMEVD